MGGQLLRFLFCARVAGVEKPGCASFRGVIISSFPTHQTPCYQNIETQDIVEGHRELGLSARVRGLGEESASFEPHRARVLPRWARVVCDELSRALEVAPFLVSAAQ